MDSKYFDDQMDGEDVLYVFRKHPVVMRKGLILSMIAIMLGTIPTAVKPELGFGWFFGGLGVGFVLSALVFLPYWIAWYFSVFIVTNMRFIQITQKGFFNKSVVDLELKQIQMVNYEVAGLQETLLKFGTIMLQTYLGELIIHDIHHPAGVQKKLFEILRKENITVNSPGQENTQ